jgi:transposase
MSDSKDPAAPSLPESDDDHTIKASTIGGTPSLVGASAAGGGVATASAAGAADESGTRLARPRRPCFHCGTMTPIGVLERTGDLCWRCYRPLGYTIVKYLLLSALAVGGLAGGIIGYRMWSKSRDVAPPAAEEGGAREFTTEQKVALLRRHLVDREPVADLCQATGVDPGEFRRWREQFLEAAEAAFERDQDREPNAVEKRIGIIEQKLAAANKVMGELRDNLVQLKRESSQYEVSPTQRFILDSSGPPPK